MKKQMQVDRFEEGFAVLCDENDRIYNVPRDGFGFALREGDVLAVELADDIPISATLLQEETEKRKARIAALMKQLKKKS